MAYWPGITPFERKVFVFCPICVLPVPLLIDIAKLDYLAGATVTRFDAFFIEYSLSTLIHRNAADNLGLDEL